MIKGLRKSFVVFFVMFCGAVLFASATEINQTGVPIKTDTNIVTNGNITDITTNTAIKGGTVGVNTFGKFNVSKGDIVNLNLINGQNKLVNLIYDSSPSQINGIINSYMNGKIGGNVLFANPNGFVIGADGVFNVGSLTLMTPTQQSMNSFVNNIDPLNPVLNETQINKLIGFTFNGDKYLVGGDSTDPIKLQQATIEVYGKINSANGIDLITGGTVDVKSGAQLNANLEFTYDENDIMTGYAPKTGVTPSSPSTFAMNDGNGIVIVSSNDGSGDFLGAIVNLNGNVNANGSNIIVKSEISGGATTSSVTGSGSLTANELYLGSDGTITSTAAILVESLEVLAESDINLSNTNNELKISSIVSNGGNIVLSSKTLDITNLKSHDANLTTTGLTKLGTAELSAFTLNAGSANIKDLTSETTIIKTKDLVEIETANVNDLSLVAGSANIKDLTTKNRAKFNVSGALTLDKGVVGFIDAEVNSLEVKTSLESTSTVDSSILRTTTGDLTIESLTTKTDVYLTSKDNLSLATVNVDGKFTSTSTSLAITTLNSKETNITTTGLAKLDTANIDGNAVIKSTAGNVSLGKTTVTGTLNAGAKKDLTINGDTNITGKTTLSAGDNLVFENTKNVVFGNDLTIEKTGAVNLETLTVNGNLKTDASILNITDKLTVTGTANLGSKSNIYIKDTDINILDTKGATNVTIDNLNVKQNGTIIANGDVVLTKTNIGGDFKLESKNLTLKDTTTVTGTTSLKATEKLTFAPDDVTFNNDLTIEKGTGIVEVNHLTVNGNANLNSNGATNITTAVINGDLKTDASILNITDKLTVTGTANLGSKSNIYIKDTDINILDTKGATNVTIDNLNVKQNGTIIANGDVVLTKTNIGGDFKLESKNLTLKDTTTVTGTTSLKATEKLTFAPDDVTFNNDLTIEKGTGIVEVNHLTVNGNANLNSNGATNITTAVINGDLKTDASILNITDKLTVTGTANLGSKSNIYIKDTDINILDTKGATNVTIDNLNVKQNGTIIANGDVVLTKTNIGGDFKLESKNLTLKDTTTVTGTTSLKATEKLTFVPDDVTFNNDLTIEEGTGTVEINNLTVTGGKTIMHSNELITIRNAQLDDLTTYAKNMTVDNMTVEGPINTNNTGNLIITNKLIANDEVNMRSDASITIKDADMAKDLYLNSKNAKIEEINLIGKMNGNVDKLNVNTSNDLNIGNLRGKSKSYVTSTTINTEKAIVNALDDNKAINIYGKNIKLVSVDNTATADKPLNLKLAKNNNITLLSDGDIEVFTTGEVGNYRKIVTDHLKIKTDSYGVNIYSAVVKIDGDIRTADKHIIIDNTTWEPNLYVTLQLRSIVSPHYLFVDGSPFISTQSINALRHGMNIYVNKTKDATSMNSWLTSSIEACMKTINTTQKTYEEMTKNENFEAVIKTVNGEIVSPDNVVEFVNYK